MTIKEQMEMVQDALNVWHKGVGGSCKIANDEPNLFQILGEAPGAPRTAILFDEEDPRDAENNDISGRVDRKFIIAVSRGRGFKLELGKTLTEGVAGGLPMFELVEQSREILRKLRVTEVPEESVPRYYGSKRLQFQGITTDAYAVTIGLPAQIPDQYENE